MTTEVKRMRGRERGGKEKESRKSSCAQFRSTYPWCPDRCGDVGDDNGRAKLKSTREKCRVGCGERQGITEAATRPGSYAGTAIFGQTGPDPFGAIPLLQRDHNTRPHFARTPPGAAARPAGVRRWCAPASAPPAAGRAGR